MKLYLLLLIPFFAFGQLQVASGTYTGNGSDDRTISGIGFQPEVVIIKNSSTASGVWRSDAHGALDTTSSFHIYASFSNMIQSFTSDGFVLGGSSNVNQNTLTYYWIALAGEDVAAFTYTGDGVTDREITVGFQAKAIFAKKDAGNTASEMMFKTADMSANTAPLSGGILLANIIKTITSTGFTVGNGGRINGSGITYYGFALKGDYVDVGTYTGDGNDDRTISTTATYTPELVLSVGNNASSAAFRPSILVGDLTLTTGLTAEYANGIQSIGAGSFQVGTDGRVNQSTIVYDYIVLKSYTEPSTETDKGFKEYPKFPSRPKFPTR